VPPFAFIHLRARASATRNLELLGMSNSLDKPPRKGYANKGRPLTEKHKRAIREGRMRAKIMRELAVQGAT